MRGTLAIVGSGSVNKSCATLSGVSALRRRLGKLSCLRHGLQRSDALDLRNATHEHGIAVCGEYSVVRVDRILI